MTIDEKLKFLKEDIDNNYIKYMRKAVTEPVYERNNGELNERPATQAEVEERIVLVQKNFNDYVKLLNNTPQLIEESKKIIPENMMEAWVKVLMRGLSVYGMLYVSPLNEYNIHGFLSAAKILATIKEKGVSEASKLMEANTNSDVWDYDTLLVIKYGGQAGKNCFKQSERYKQKMATLDEEYKKEINDKLNNEIEQITIR